MADVQSEELGRLTAWLVDTVVQEGRGGLHDHLEVKPSEKFWGGWPLNWA